VVVHRLGGLAWVVGRSPSKQAALGDSICRRAPLCLHPRDKTPRLLITCGSFAPGTKALPRIDQVGIDDRALAISRAFGCQGWEVTLEIASPGGAGAMFPRPTSRTFGLHAERESRGPASYRTRPADTNHLFLRRTQTDNPPHQ